ncbi:helix-hairpin-helix domain-containing protein [Nonomuraea sp. NPDC050790]|uniref:helix-hairpin-helix domain-containing protein n=1 Tax=Nonomuraea sp. NPDC050790 TaxID=3364371 RepID=UPI00379C72CE
MRSPDPTTEQAIAEARLRSITHPGTGERTPGLPPTFQAFRAAVATQAPTRTGVRVLIAIGVLAAAIAAFTFWRSTPTPAPLPPPPAAPTTPRPTASVTIHITGKVRTPGVYRLPTGSRVTDALAAAGGLRKGIDPSPLNLARRLIDGEQIAVGAPEAMAALAADPATSIIDLNTATPTQLEQLPGVGEVLATRIAEFRDTNGGFTSVDQLKEVTGIGPRKYEDLKDRVRV